MRFGAIGIFAVSSLFAQSLGFPPNATGRSTGSSMIPGQSSRYPVCTPADYGDPSADCIPPNTGSAYSSYNPYDWNGTGNSFPINPLMQPYPQYDREDDQERQPAVARPVHYEKELPTEFQR